MHPLNFFQGEDQAYLAQQIEKVFTEGEATAEAGFVTRSGEVIPYFFTGRRIELNGAPCLIGMGLDITERKQADEALRVSRRRLQATLDIMLEGCQLIGFGWEYLYLNDAAVAQNRRPRAAFEGRTMLEAFQGLEQTDVFAVLKRSMETRSHERFETQFMFPDGASRWFDLSVQPVEEGIFILSHDVTERKQTEIEIRQLNAELEQRVLDRTAQLAVSNARLTTKNEELKGFAYTVSHDLKAPLRGIAGYAQELERRHSDGLSERAGFCVRQILTATRNLERLIEDLLQYSRLEAETPSLSQVNVPAMLDSLLRDRSPLIAERAVSVRVASPVENLTTWPRGLTQVFANLIDNALKYSRGAAAPVLDISGEERDGKYLFQVRDNGIGFDMKYHDRIFGLFNRLVRPDEFEGTGAGLAIVKKLVDKMGGRIWAESAPGEGATFFVELPKISAE
jgi:signal transduction histidine kinase